MQDKIQIFVGSELKVNGERKVDEKDSLFKEIKALFPEDTRFRFWFPGTIGTMDLRSDRVNVKLEKENGKWIIKRIYIG